MKIKDLIEIIDTGKKDYSDFLEWDIAFEQVDNPENDPYCKDDILIGKNNWDDGIDWKFIKSHSMGCCTYFIKAKTLGLQIHY